MWLCWSTDSDVARRLWYGEYLEGINDLGGKFAAREVGDASTKVSVVEVRNVIS